jgi:hypothetical protein
MPTCARVRAHELVTAHLDDSVGAANQSDQKKQRCCFEARPGAVRTTGRSAELDDKRQCRRARGVSVSASGTGGIRANMRS